MRTSSCSTPLHLYHTQSHRTLPIVATYLPWPQGKKTPHSISEHDTFTLTGINAPAPHAATLALKSL